MRIEHLTSCKRFAIRAEEPDRPDFDIFVCLAIYPLPQKGAHLMKIILAFQEKRGVVRKWQRYQPSTCNPTIYMTEYLSADYLFAARGGRVGDRSISIRTSQCFKPT